MTQHYYHKDENALRSATAAIPDVIDIGESPNDCGAINATAVPMLPAPAVLDEFKVLAAKMSKEEMLAAIEHLKALVA